MLRTLRWILISVVLAFFAGVWLLSVSMSWSMLTRNNNFTLFDANGGDPVLHQHYHYVVMFGKLIEIYPIWLPHVVAVTGAVMIVAGLLFLMHFGSRRLNVDIGAAAEDENAH